VTTAVRPVTAAVRPSRDAGAASIWVLAAVAVVMVVVAAGMLLAAVQAARQRADAAADLAALAGAAVAARGGDGCAAAARLAAADGALLPACSAVAGVVTVSAAVSLPPAVRALGVRNVRARARAGPVSPGGTGGAA
jgi:secretion/DNA translocation related TadE-like protein